MVLWRISNHDSLSGEGGLRSEGRWHPLGCRIVYCTQSPAAALLEMLVRAGLGPERRPIHYRLLRVEAPDAIAMEALGSQDLQADWVSDVGHTQAIGSAWLGRARTPLLLVPSAVAPHTSNVLINPAHSSAVSVTVAAATDHVLDSRLVRISL